MNVAIIVAAGRGTRLGGERAKQFLLLAGKPVIVHTLERFERCAEIQEVIVVLPAGEAAGFLAQAGRYGLRKLARVVAGGATRAASVRCGLQAVRAATACVVAVHDGVRPFVTPDEIGRTVRAAAETGAAILVAPAVDTIKEVEDNGVVRTLERVRLRRALTPQCFRYELLRRAYEQRPDLVSAATDDSSLVEALGSPVRIIEGDARNIKITRPEDIALAEILLKQHPEFRSQNSD
ncbi:MAG TPA: 2-C-methyl-D-erythritol 4-phosphate cytidylyltransferase [Pyrinomonadaceae bacterium]|nr:2-C-methyl-D-erythritol 4-phosphate cytidylyltransferase [Pyrinomonadaceae bacterium]